MAKFFAMEWAQLFKTALEESEKFKSKNSLGNKNKNKK